MLKIISRVRQLTPRQADGRGYTPPEGKRRVLGHLSPEIALFPPPVRRLRNR
jgi:hypothetical protein